MFSQYLSVIYVSKSFCYLIFALNLLIAYKHTYIVCIVLVLILGVIKLLRDFYCKQMLKLNIKHHFSLKRPR